MSKYYDRKYADPDLYWGRQPSTIARILFQMFPPSAPRSLLDVGCGEGRDSIFFAHNGYEVSAFDSSAEGIKKASAWADQLKLAIRFFKADINTHRLEQEFDVVFGSSSLHYLQHSLRQEVVSNYKDFTAPHGLNAFTVPIRKPFLAQDPDTDELEQPWRSGEILTLYHDWKIEFFTEEILDEPSGYRFPVNRLIARNPSA
jgi:tellurite methyltransferase